MTISTISESSAEQSTETSGRGGEKSGGPSRSGRKTREGTPIENQRARTQIRRSRSQGTESHYCSSFKQIAMKWNQLVFFLLLLLMERWGRNRCWLESTMPRTRSTSPNWLRKYPNWRWRYRFLVVNQSSQLWTGLIWNCFFVFLLQNEVNIAEGELSMVEDSDRIRELVERVGDLKAEVTIAMMPIIRINHCM